MLIDKEQRCFTTAEKASAKASWAKGKSARTVAAELSHNGKSTTANDIKRLWRQMKLPEKPSGAVRSVRLASDLFGPLPSLKAREEVFVKGKRAPQTTVDAVLSLGEHSCRWPIGDPRKEDFCFCSRKTLAGLSYCAYHAEKSKAPPK